MPKNAYDYGYRDTCNGDDNATAIMAAMAALPSCGGIVDLPSYDTEVEIAKFTPDRPLRVRGECVTGARLILKANNDDALMSLSSRADCGFEKVTANGNKANQGASNQHKQNAIHAVKSSRYFYEDVHLFNFNENAVRNEGSCFGYARKARLGLNRVNGHYSIKASDGTLAQHDDIECTTYQNGDDGVCFDPGTNYCKAKFTSLNDANVAAVIYTSPDDQTTCVGNHMEFIAIGPGQEGLGLHGGSGNYLKGDIHNPGQNTAATARRSGALINQFTGQPRNENNEVHLRIWGAAEHGVLVQGGAQTVYGLHGSIWVRNPGLAAANTYDGLRADLIDRMSLKTIISDTQATKTMRYGSNVSNAGTSYTYGDIGTGVTGFINGAGANYKNHDIFNWN